MTERKWYPVLLVTCYSLLGIFFPAAVTQFSMVVDDLAILFTVDKSVILFSDTLRAVCLVTAMFLSGYIYRKFGLRRTIALGICFQILPQFMIPLAMELRSLPLLFVMKAMQGLNAIAFPLYIASITMWVDHRYAALATAIFNGSFVSGSGVGAFLAGRIIPVFGARSSFLVIGTICGIFAVPALLLTKEKEGCCETSAASQSRHKGVYRNVIRKPATWLMVAALIANTWVTQAVTVDMPVFSADFGIGYGQRGSLMLLISIVTVISSIAAGAVSDYAASRSDRPVRCRSLVLGAGYALSAVMALLIMRSAAAGFLTLAVTACLMMFGVSWAAGVFWALPVAIYAPEDNVAGTAFCSGASNIPNPIAPMLVGVILGSRGLWQAGWMTCCAVSVLSLAAAVMLARKTESRGAC